MNKVINKYNTLSIFEQASYSNISKRYNNISDNAIMGLKTYKYKEQKKKSIWERIKDFFVF